MCACDPVVCEFLHDFPDDLVSGVPTIDRMFIGRISRGLPRTGIPEGCDTSRELGASAPKLLLEDPWFWIRDRKSVYDERYDGAPRVARHEALVARVID